MKYDIDFLGYNKLYNLCGDVVKNLQKSVVAKENTLYNNVVDPFSAIFEASFHKISLTEWTKVEKAR